MPIILGPGPAKGVPLEGLKKAISLNDFIRKPDCWGQAAILRKSVPAASRGLVFITVRDAPKRIVLVIIRARSVLWGMAD